VERIQILSQTFLARTGLGQEFPEGFELGCCRWRQPVKNSCTVPLIQHQFRTPQDGEVSRNRWLGNLQHRLQVTDADVTLPQ
jgi:hypothetical protein